MTSTLITAIRTTLVLAIFFCGVYTLSIWGIAQLKTPDPDFSNIAQKFTEDRYFWSRPSAVDYNATAAGGSNKGPSNPDYLQTVSNRIDSFLAHNPGVRKSEIPSDLVTASGSGLDPHISVQAATVQAARIARARGLAEGNIQQLILAHIQHPTLGIFGTTHLNVLQLNKALDQLK